MKEKLTREKALELHRRMWGDMRAALGNNPTYIARMNFKKKWCAEHGFKNVMSHCFLCEYDEQKNGDCDCCLIDWSPLTFDGEPHCYDWYCTADGRYKVAWVAAPIDEILSLPERTGV